MAQNQVILQFRFTTFGDCMMEKMNFLRRQRRFCDVVVRINELEVPGHKVVFAAGSSFLRDQFILQQDAREVQISLIQEAEVGRQLLLSCYTGQLEFPELELVHYLTVASFLQMGHIVEQCNQALNKFIKPQPQELQVDSRGRDRKEEALSSPPQKELEYPQTQTSHQEDGTVEQVEDEDGDDDADDDADDDDVDVVIMQRSTPPPPQSQHVQRDVPESDITIVKVESVMDAAENSLAGHVPASPAPTAAALHSPEPQHSLINSTVDTHPPAEMEMALPSVPGHPLGLPPQSWKQGNQGGGYQRNHDKPIQWYHQCPKCPCIFKQLENYTNHLKMHKLFMCLLCGKTFTPKGNLHRHMRVHAGIKPFQCKICGNTFTQKCSLHRHMGMHAGIKPFQCKICRKTFTQKCSLLDHLNLHSGDKPHCCNYCEMVFAHKRVLLRHLKQIHGKNSFDNANEQSLQDGGLDFEYGRV